MQYPNDRRYTTDHEWAQRDGNVVTVGITHYAQESLGDVVYVELPKVGQRVERGGSFGSVESTKAVSDLFAPVSGQIVEVNDDLPDAPETVNVDPHAKAWMIRIEADGSDEFDALMDGPSYEAHLRASGH